MSERESDLQSDAFHGADDADLVTDDQLAQMCVSGELIVTTGQPVRTPADFEAAGWDDGRSSPKTLPEAKAALSARVMNPRAPDRDSSAYSGLVLG